jgi:hypothetical protein
MSDSSYPRYYAVTSPIAASPRSLSFRAYQGGSNPASQTLWIANGIYDRWEIEYDLTWSTSESLDWLSLSVTSGHAYGIDPTSSVASVNIAGKSVGNYSGNITFSSSMVSSYQNTTVSASLTIANLHSVTITGPTELESGQSGTWNASVSGGFTPYHYQWYYYPECAKLTEKGEGFREPPCGYWYSWGFDQSSASRSDDSDFRVKCEVADALGTVRTSNVISVTVVGSLARQRASEEAGADLVAKLNPTVLAFSGAYPNPFNPSTTLLYNLPEAGYTRLAVMDVLGREVVVLDEGSREDGSYRCMWDGRSATGESVAGGLYFARLVVQGAGGKPTQIKLNKLFLVK